MRGNRWRASGMVAAAGAIVFLGTVGLAGAGDDAPAKKDGVEAKAVFARLKKLKGTWKVEYGASGEAAKLKKAEEHKAEHGAQQSVVFKLTGAGSALVETQLPGARTRWSPSTTSTATTCG